MKILPAVVYFLVCFFSGQSSYSQDTAVNSMPVEDSVMQDTIIARNPHFIVRPYTIPHYEMQDTVIARVEHYSIPRNIYATRDSLDAIMDSIRAINVYLSKMQDTTILLESAFLVRDVYAAKDSLDAIQGSGPPLSKRDSLIKAMRDSLNAIGNALMRSAEMQDTTIVLDPSFFVRSMYAGRDSLQAIRDSVRTLTMQRSKMQDTTIEKDPAFIVVNAYANKDKYDSFRDSVWATLAQAARMQDTTILLDPSFRVVDVYYVRDRQTAIQDSVARPLLMQDTTVVRDSVFVIIDRYALKDSLDANRDSLTVIADSLYTDSVNLH